MFKYKLPYFAVFKEHWSIIVGLFTFIVGILFTYFMNEHRSVLWLASWILPTIVVSSFPITYYLYEQLSRPDAWTLQLLAIAEDLEDRPRWSRSEEAAELINAILNYRSAIALVGPSGAGKSYIIRQDALHLAEKHSITTSHISMYEFQPAQRFQEILSLLSAAKRESSINSLSRVVFIDQFESILQQQDQLKIIDACLSSIFLVPSSLGAEPDMGRSSHLQHPPSIAHSAAVIPVFVIRSEYYYTFVRWIENRHHKDFKRVDLGGIAFSTEGQAL